MTNTLGKTGLQRGRLREPRHVALANELMAVHLPTCGGGDSHLGVQ